MIESRSTMDGESGLSPLEFDLSTTTFSCTSGGKLSTAVMGKCAEVEFVEGQVLDWLCVWPKCHISSNFWLQSILYSIYVIILMLSTC